MVYDCEMGWFFEKGEIWYRSEKRGFRPTRPEVVHWKGYLAFGALLAIMLVEIRGLSFLPAHSFVRTVLPFATMIVFLVIHNRHHEIVEPGARPQSPDELFPGDRKHGS
jgi:hypothetical protein